jgi:outer membrane murein-binding lipoprotein Lpp
MMSGLQNSMKFGAMQEEMMGKLQKMYAPFYKIIPPSREKEMAQIVVDMQSDLMKYQTKVAEMNYMIGNSVRQASEKLMRDLFERAKEGEMVVKSYNEFFLTWLNVLEEQMIELFKSDEFSKIQGEVLSLQLDLKTAVNKGVEYLLSPYPVVMHSQIDDLTKQVHALKSKIRALEKQLSDQNAQAEAVTEDAAIEVEVSEDEKKTSSRRKSVK